jgi:hypothetical protein
MPKTEVLRLPLLIALAAASLPAADRPGFIMSGSVELTGVVVRFTTMAEPPAKDLQGMGGGVTGRKDRISREMLDPVTHQYFGYDLIVAPGDAPGRHTVKFEPLSLRAENMQLLLPKYPPPQIVQDGDIIALDLLESPDGRQKIVDYIEITSKVEPPAARTTKEPRDFTLDDGPLRFDFRLPTKLLINGQPYTGTYGMTGKPGATLWFAVPGHGRYILSLTPQPGFQKSGAIRGNVLAFQAGADEYELRTSGPITPSGGSWNLYLLHDASFPTKDSIQYGTDRLENLLPKK